MQEAYSIYELLDPIEHTDSACQCIGKKCRGCQEVKCYGHFCLYKKERPAGKGNLRSYCRPCDGKRGGEYIRQRRIANARQWNATHPEKMRERAKIQARRRRENPQIAHKLAQYRQQLYQQNPAHYTEQVRRNQVRRKLRDPEAYQACMTQKRHRRRARKMQAGGSFTSKQWCTLKAYYDYTCLCCGKREPEIKLTPDHVIPLAKEGINSIENIQPLCRSCNSRKGTKSIDYREKEGQPA